MTYRMTRLLFISFVFLFLSNAAFSQQKDALFNFDPTSKSSKDALIPIANSVKEWDISLNADLIGADTDYFDLVLPGDGKTDQVLSVVRTFFRRYASGNTQWIGEIIIDSKPSSKQKQGYIIVNIIDGEPFAVINLNNHKYEIYSDQKVGSRLAKIAYSVQPTDVVVSSSLAFDSISAPSSFSGVAGTSVVDVLVLIDISLNFAGSPIFSRITSEMMNADAILALSGPNQVGVPLVLNLLPIETIAIPSNLENITCSANFPYNCPSFDTMVDGVSSTSLSLINKLNNTNADVVALYVPFNPSQNPPAQTFEVCGVAGLPLNVSQDSSFKNSFSLHASECTTTQFVLFHEIMHNFGSHHVQGNTAFTPYAHGIDIFSSGGDFSTMMACTGFVAGDDPSETNCNRIAQLSSPLVTENGHQIGNATHADNVRFLSECTASACRRVQLANRRNGTNPVDLLPTVNILTPANGATILATNSYALTANASDDNGIVLVDWRITKNGQTVASGFGSGANYSFNTSAFATGGNYIVSASAQDTIGQITIDTHVVTVNADSFPVVNILTPANGSTILATNSYTLTASASDDNGIVSVGWNISKNGQTVASGFGSGANYSFNTNAFATAGNYVISASAQDTIGQVTVDTHVVTVNDSFPVINILTPANNETILPTSSYLLTAQASDDIGIVSVNWTIATRRQIVFSGTGTGANYSIVTNAFTNSKKYVVTARVEDTAGQFTIDQHMITVLPTVDISTSISLANSTTVEVEVQNLGPDVAHNIGVLLFASASDGGMAGIYNLPQECTEITFVAASDPSFIVKYYCVIDSLAVNQTYTFGWDLLCPTASLKFDAIINNLDETDINPNNDADTYYHLSNVCNY